MITKKTHTIFKLMLTVFLCSVSITSAVASTIGTYPEDDDIGSPANVATKAIRGDVNEDGECDVTDVMLIVQYILHYDMSAHHFRSELADLDGDKDVTVSDVMIVVNIILGKPTIDPDNPRFPIDTPEGDDPANGV